MTAASDPDLDRLRAIAHPLRLRILSLVTGESLSAAEIGRRLGESQANVSYHLRKLAASGLVTLDESVVIRGGVAKRYRHDLASGEAIDRGDPAGHLALMSTVADELRRRAADYRPDTPIAFTDAELFVSPATLRDALALARELGVLLHDRAVGAAEPGAVRVSATVALFETTTQEIATDAAATTIRTAR